MEFDSEDQRRPYTHNAVDATIRTAIKKVKRITIQFPNGEI